MVKYRIYFYNSETGETVLPKNAVESDLLRSQTLFLSLKQPDSFIGFETGNNTVIQLLLQKNAMWWLELLDTSKPKAIGTQINIPMAERAIELIYSGDVNLIRFKAEYPFLQWKEVSSERS